jgi:hypothetical protein
MKNRNYLSELNRDDIYCVYATQPDPQPAYIQIDEDGEVSASYSSGNGCSPDVWHKRTLQIPISPTVDLDQLRHYLNNDGGDLIDIILDGHSVEWNGSNHVGRLTSDAEDALIQLEQDLLGLPYATIWSSLAEYETGGSSNYLREGAELYNRVRSKISEVYVIMTEIKNSIEHVKRYDNQEFDFDLRKEFDELVDQILEEYRDEIE